MMTLSLGEALRFDAPPPAAAKARWVPSNAGNTGAARGPNQEGPRRRFSFLERVPWRRHSEVTVTRGSASALQAVSEQAARPAATVEERSDALVLSLDAPGARPKNVEVIWDSEARRLAVGVWARHPRRRRGFPQELIWYRSHWLPRCAGDAARVSVNGGRIEITVPWDTSESRRRSNHQA